MRTLNDILVFWPMLGIWLAVVSAIFLCRQTSRMLLVFALVFLLAGSLPETGKALLLSLANATPKYSMIESGMEDRKFTAIVVFLAGAFIDPGGRWWPLEGSV
jgi:uncharacterized membrane protein|tara:strand:+ start:354 stop:662 length:309 start_codon:yes stop_codon:yes gene_type:complete